MSKIDTQIIILLADFFSKRRDVVKALRSLANEINVKQRDMDIAKTSFATTGIIGTGLAIGGIIAAPFTFGASLGLTIAGAAVGVGSGLGGLATTIADRIISSNTMKEAQEAVESYEKMVSDLMRELKKLDVKDLATQGDFDLRKIGSIRSLREEDRKQAEIILRAIRSGFNYSGQAAQFAGAVGLIGFKTVTATAGKTATAALAGVRALRIGGAALSLMTLPLDLHILVTNSIKIHKKTPSAVAEQILEVAQKLEDHKILEDNSA